MRDRVRKLLDTIDSQQGELRKAAELVLDAGKKDAETLADEVIAYLEKSGKIR